MSLSDVLYTNFGRNIINMANSSLVITPFILSAQERTPINNQARPTFIISRLSALAHPVATIMSEIELFPEDNYFDNTAPPVSPADIQRTSGTPQSSLRLHLRAAGLPTPPSLIPPDTEALLHLRLPGISHLLQHPPTLQPSPPLPPQRNGLCQDYAKRSSVPASTSLAV